jgi:hypothetical protein
MITKDSKNYILFIKSLWIVNIDFMSDISFVFFAISWGAVIGLYINYTNLHEDKFKKLMIGLLIFSLTFTVITF